AWASWYLYAAFSAELFSGSSGVSLTASKSSGSGRIFPCSSRSYLVGILLSLLPLVRLAEADDIALDGRLAPSHSEARTPRISHRLTGIGGGAFERNARMAVSISVRRVSENQARMRTTHPPPCSTPNRRAAAIQRPTPPSSRRGWARKRSPR